MFSKKRVLTTLILLFAVPLVAFAAAPESLSVLINGKALSGKALWYNGQVYVPLKSVSDALDAKYDYSLQRGVASVDMSGGRNITISPADRPFLKIINQKMFSTGDNIKVLATVENKGLVPARELEIVCTFHGDYRNRMVASVATLPDLKPGERKTLEFWLYEQRIPDAKGGRPYAQPMSVPGAYQGRGNQDVFVGFDVERIRLEWEFNYLNPDNTYSSKRG